MPAIANRRTFVERAAPSSAVRVDHEAGIIRGAKLVGIVSDNNRRYPLATLKAARHLYEGARVNVDHPPSARSLERSFTDWAGVVENVRVGADGLYGDLRLRKEGPSYHALMEAAERFPESFGLSHVASGDCRKVGGIEEVTEISEVVSVDVVTEPATTAGLFESRRRPAVPQADDAGLADLARRIAALERQADADRELADIAFGFDAKAEQARARLAARRRR